MGDILVEPDARSIEDEKFDQIYPARIRELSEYIGRLSVSRRRRPHSWSRRPGHVCWMWAVDQPSFALSARH